MPSELAQVRRPGDGGVGGDPTRDGRLHRQALELGGRGGVVALPTEGDGDQPPLLGFDGRAGDAVRSAPEGRLPRARAHRAGVTAPP